MFKIFITYQLSLSHNIQISVGGVTLKFSQV